MSREVHVRICESVRVKLPRATRPLIARVDLGFRTWITQTFRLRGIDAPELTCALGQKAKAEVMARLRLCSWLVIKTYKQEKYGRFLADVFYQKGAEDRERVLNVGAFLNQELLDAGLAVPYCEKAGGVRRRVLSPSRSDLKNE